MSQCNRNCDCVGECKAGAEQASRARPSDRVSMPRVLNFQMIGAGLQALHDAQVLGAKTGDALQAAHTAMIAVALNTEPRAGDGDAHGHVSYHGHVKEFRTYDEWLISNERTKRVAENLALAAEVVDLKEQLRMSHLALESAHASLYPRLASQRNEGDGNGNR